MDLELLAENLEATAYSEFLRSEFWFVPALQSLHILGVCFVFTGLIFLSSRAFSLSWTNWKKENIAAKLSPFLYYGYITLFITGILQVIAEPAREIPNPLFQLKLVLVFISIPISYFIIKKFRENSGSDKLLAAVSAINITAIIFAGRWIAYI